MQQRFYDNLPEFVPRPIRGKDNQGFALYPETGSRYRMVTAGARVFGRSMTLSRIHASEAAYYPNAAELMKGAMNALSQNGSIVIESTANGAQGWFYELCMETLEAQRYGKPSGFKLHFYPWFFDSDTLPAPPDFVPDDYERELIRLHGVTHDQLEWRRWKIAKIGLRDFNQEYPDTPENAFLMSDESVFGIVDHALLPVDHVPTLNPKHTYIGGVDWGQVDDYTALSIICLETGEEVYLNRWRKMPYVEMRACIIDACIAHNVRLLTVERNSASSNYEDLVREFESRGYYLSLNSRVMTNELKARMVTVMSNGIHQGHLKLLNIDYANRELRAYTSKQSQSGQWVYSHPVGGHDDTVDARLYAYFETTQRW